GHPVLCETDVEAGVALISLPALGAAQVSRRARRLAVSLVTALHESRTADPTAIAAASGGARVRQTRSEEGGVLLSTAEGALHRDADARGNAAQQPSREAAAGADGLPGGGRRGRCLRDLL